eukprot:4504783-Amphidinium_carterae.1
MHMHSNWPVRRSSNNVCKTASNDERSLPPIASSLHMTSCTSHLPSPTLVLALSKDNFQVVNTHGARNHAWTPCPCLCW